MKSLRIVFMGTPEFAVATLGCLMMNGFNVVAVITAPDKPSGRGRKIKRPAVKEFAEHSCLPIIQPDNLKDPAFINTLTKLKADVFIVVAFRMLPEVVWKLPKLGTINLHASLLPQYRGAAPINHVIMNGETETGVTTFFIDENIDTGNILLRERITIFPMENAGELHDRLMRHGSRLVIKTLEGLAANNLKPVSQSSLIKPGETLRTAPRILPENCIIDWNNDAVNIQNIIRGLAPVPGARTFLKHNGESCLLKIYDSQPESEKHRNKPGHIISDGKFFLKIACRDGYINVLNLQTEGKKRMTTVEFLQGYRISKNHIAIG